MRLLSRPAGWRTSRSRSSLEAEPFFLKIHTSTEYPEHDVISGKELDIHILELMEMIAYFQNDSSDSFREVGNGIQQYFQMLPWIHLRKSWMTY